MVRYIQVESPSQKFWRVAFTCLRGLLIVTTVGLGLFTAVGLFATRVSDLNQYDGFLGPILAGTAVWAGVASVLAVVVGVVSGIIIKTRWRAVCFIVALFAFFMALLIPGGPYPNIPSVQPVTGNRTQVKVFEANLLFTNTDNGAGIAKEIEEEQPDIVFLAETSPGTASALEPVLRALPYRFTVDAEAHNGASAGLALYSKYPLTGLRRIDLPVRPALMATADINGTPTRLIAIHLPAPVDRDWTKGWADAYRTLDEVMSGYNGPLIMAGDFNSTVAHAPFRDFTEKHALTDVTGSHPTWPQNGYPIPLFGFNGPTIAAPIPPVLGLDHVLAREFIPTLVRVGVGAGSDHRPVVAHFILGKNKEAK